MSSVPLLEEGPLALSGSEASFLSHRHSARGQVGWGEKEWRDWRKGEFSAACEIEKTVREENGFEKIAAKNKSNGVVEHFKEQEFESRKICLKFHTEGDWKGVRERERETTADELVERVGCIV